LVLWFLPVILRFPFVSPHSPLMKRKYRHPGLAAVPDIGGFTYYRVSPFFRDAELAERLPPFSSFPD